MIEISVIIPIYKGKKYLPYWEGILSLNFKTYKKEYDAQCEAVFVNDYPEERIELNGSDTCMRICHSEKNRGIHGARVFGYEQAQGDYIVFLDQDDKISEDYLVEQRKNIGMADAVVCNGYRERLWMRGKRQIFPHDSRMNRIESSDDRFLEENPILSPGQVLIRKEAVPKLWLTEIMRENGADDYFLWILMRSAGCVFRINHRCLYTHMEYGGNTSNQGESMSRSLLEMTLLLEKNNIAEGRELETLRQRNQRENNENRYLRIVRVYDYWMYLNIRGIQIETYFISHGYKRIVIYGMNYVGNRLYDTLYSSVIEVIFGIDKDAENIAYEIPIFRMESLELAESLEQIDAVVVTAVSSFQKISCDMQKLCNKPILSIESILLEMIGYGWE